MTKTQITLLALVAAASLALTFHFRHRSQARLREIQARIDSSASQLDELNAENRRLSNRVAAAENEPPPDHAGEISNLRQTEERLRSQTNKLAQSLGTTRSEAPAQPEPPPKQRTPEYFEQLHQLAGGKPRDAMRLVMAIRGYASDHDDQVPTGLDQLSSYLGKGDSAVSGTNAFEIVFHGSLQDLQGVPAGAVALVRDNESWIGPEGKPMRVYGMADGSGLIVGADESIQSWEAQHIIGGPTKQK